MILTQTRLFCSLLEKFNTGLSPKVLHYIYNLITLWPLEEQHVVTPYLVRINIFRGQLSIVKSCHNLNDLEDKS